MEPYRRRRLLEYRCLYRDWLYPGWYVLQWLVFPGHEAEDPNLVFSVLTDLICSFLPVIVLWNVKISRGKKIAICGLMATGLVSVNPSVRLV